MGCGTSTPAEVEKTVYQPRGNQCRKMSVVPSEVESVAESMHHRSEASVSRGVIAEESLPELEMRKKLIILNARIRHGVTADPDQWDGTHKAQVSPQTRTAIRNFLDDHIKESLEAELVSPTKHAASFNESVSTAGLSNFSATQEGSSCTSLATATLVVPVITEEDARSVGRNSTDNHQNCSQGGELFSVTSETTPEFEDDLALTPRVKASSHFELPPMTLRHTLDMNMVQMAMDNEELDTPLATFLAERCTGSSRVKNLRNLAKSTESCSQSIIKVLPPASPLASDKTDDLKTMVFSTAVLALVNGLSPVCHKSVCTKMEKSRPALNLRWILTGNPATAQFNQMCASSMADALQSDPQW